MTTIVIRFVGRLVSVPDPRGAHKNDTGGRVHVLGINMQFNRCLNVAPHRLLLSVPRENLVSGYPRADAEIVTAAQQATAVQEYLLWDLANSVLSIVGAAQTGVTFDFTNVW